MSRRRRGAGALVVLWALACLGGVIGLWRYEARPADAGAPPPRWPSDTGLVRASDAATLVLFAHPHCPCTRATLSELEEILRRAPRAAAIDVVFSVPDGVAEGWERGELLDRARALAGIHVVIDRGGKLATDRFHVAASGHALVYDAGGALRYSGGITVARGHVGDNLGRQRALAALDGGGSDEARANVFGCALEAPP